MYSQFHSYLSNCAVNKHNSNQSTGDAAGEDENILSDFGRDDGKAAGLADFDGWAAGNTEAEHAIVKVLGWKGVLHSDTAAGEVVGDEESDAESDP
ncbi:hypothetical protein LTR15_006586 [Elasticomyces elasticus]|nr:hypothetical protein LTR15_006586 [Elasticomyces elasticus]